VSSRLIWGSVGWPISSLVHWSLVSSVGRVANGIKIDALAKIRFDCKYTMQYTQTKT